VMRLADSELFLLAWVMEGMVSERVRECGTREGKPVLFRVGVGNERVNHKVAVKDMCQKSRSCVILVAGTFTHTHARKLARRALDVGR